MMRLCGPARLDAQNSLFTPMSPAKRPIVRSDTTRGKPHWKPSARTSSTEGFVVTVVVSFVIVLGPALDSDPVLDEQAASSTSRATPTVARTTRPRPRRSTAGSLLDPLGTH